MLGLMEGLSVVIEEMQRLLQVSSWGLWWSHEGVQHWPPSCSHSKGASGFNVLLQEVEFPATPFVRSTKRVGCSGLYVESRCCL